MRAELQHLLDNWSLDIPFERSVRLNLTALERLQQSGLTWSSIADALTQAGARHKNGHPISGQQMNTVFLRVQKTMRKSLTVDMISPLQSAEESKSAAVSAQAKSVIQAKSTVRTLVTFTKVPDENTVSTESEGLAQRLHEAQRMRGAAKVEYDE
jgi:translation initiation factor IF-2